MPASATRTPVGLLSAWLLSLACSPATGTGGAEGSGATSGNGAGGLVGSGAGGTPIVGGQGAGGLLIVGGGGGPGPASGGSDSCGSVSLDASVEEVVSPGNLIIVYDQSQSMRDDWNGLPRWQAASDAVVAAITPVKDMLTIGAIFFPTADDLPLLFFPCNLDFVSAINDTASPNPQIPFMPGAQFLDAWAQHWARNPLRLSTPIEAGLKRAEEALQGSSLTGATAMILVTDGEPTCGTRQGEQGAVAAALARGVSTYVIGIPGSQGAAQTLNALAVAGGTGQYLETTQTAELEKAVRDITSTVVKRTLDSCTIRFTQLPEDPTRIVLVVTDATSGEKYQITPGADGWSLASDATVAELSGATCADALAGRFSNISFEFGCVDIPILR